jgi:NAD(P)-dependent dehydrogenase (short-subunit alcohol dehydrogenase family)
VQISSSRIDDALFDRLFAVNVKGTFNTLRLAAEAGAQRTL